MVLDTVQVKKVDSTKTMERANQNSNADGRGGNRPFSERQLDPIRKNFVIIKTPKKKLVRVYTDLHKKQEEVDNLDALERFE